MMKNTFCPVVPCPIVPAVPAVPLRYDVYTDAHVHIFIENSIDSPKNFGAQRCQTPLRPGGEQIAGKPFGTIRPPPTGGVRVGLQKHKVSDTLCCFSHL